MKIKVMSVWVLLYKMGDCTWDGARLGMGKISI